MSVNVAPAQPDLKRPGPLATLLFAGGTGACHGVVAAAANAVALAGLTAVSGDPLGQSASSYGSTAPKVAGVLVLVGAPLGAVAGLALGLAAGVAACTGVRSLARFNAVLTAVITLLLIGLLSLGADGNADGALLVSAGALVFATIAAAAHGSRLSRYLSR